MKRYVVAITGASGPILGVRLAGALLASAEVHLIMSTNTFPILRDESGIDWTGDTQDRVRTYFGTERVFFHADRNLEAPVASGSFRTEGMFVAPCSMKSLSGIAHGYAQNLIERAADVTLKEGRRLLLSPREMPFSALHLENMLRLARLGVVIAPPVAAFYQKPGGLDDMIDFFIGKMLDSFRIDHGLYRRWAE